MRSLHLSWVASWKDVGARDAYHPAWPLSAIPSDAEHDRFQRRDPSFVVQAPSGYKATPLPKPHSTTGVVARMAILHLSKERPAVSCVQVCYPG